MTSKKVVLKLEIFDEKGKKKAMKTASSLAGVESISLDMKNKKLTLIGEIDPVDIVAKLRRSFHTELDSVGPAKEPEKKKEDGNKGGDAKQGSGGGEKKEGDNKGDDKSKQGNAPKALPAIPATYYFPPNYAYPPAYYHNYHHQQYAPAAAHGYYNYRPAEEEPSGCVIC